MRVTIGVSLFLIVSCVAVCLVGGDREYDPPSPRGQSVPAASSSDALSQLLNDSKLSRLLDDPDLWLILKKRLGGGGDEDHCLADRRTNNTIIKTKDSLDAGAIFIAAPSVTNYRGCEYECCKADTCNTAVVNIKDSKNGQNEGIACYLFDCKKPSVCVFTPHPGFIIMQFESKKKSIDSQADELSELIPSTSISSSTTTTSSTAASSTTVTTKARQTENNARKDLVGLFSGCHKSSDCKDQNTDCLAGYCICRQNYHVVDMQCRKDCDQELEFECSNKNSPLFSECIAVYDYCDGIAQCSDGSDESSCLESSQHSKAGVDLSSSESDETKPQQPHSELKELSPGEEKGGGGEGEIQAKAADVSLLRSRNDPAHGVIKAPGNDRRTGTSEAKALQVLSPSEGHKDAIEDFTPRTESRDGNSPNHRPSVDNSHSNRLQTQDELTQVKYLESQRNKGKEYYGQPREQSESTEERHFERPGHDGTSYTDQLFAYGSVSGNSKKYVDDDSESHTKYRNKILLKDDPSAGDAKEDFASAGDAQSRDKMSGNEPETDQSPEEGRVDEEVEPIGQKIPSTYAAASLKSKNLEGNFGSKGEDGGSSRQVQNSAEVSRGGKGLDESRISQESVISSEHDPRYSHDHYDDRKTSLDRIKTDRHQHPVDHPSLRTSHLNVGQAKSNDANRDQMLKGHHLPPESMTPKRPLVADAADDSRRHQPLVGNSQELKPSKNHQPGHSEDDDRFLHGIVPEHQDYDQAGSKVVNTLPDGDYDQTGTKSVDVYPAHNRFDHSVSKSNKQRSNVLENSGPRPNRPGPKARGQLSQHGEYDRVNSKANDVPGHGEFERQKVKTADVLPERSEYKMLPSSELTHSGGKGHPSQNKDDYYSDGRGKVFGAYDSGNYEDEDGSPNYATWLKPEDQGNDPGSYVDPQQQTVGDLSDSYDGDSYVDLGEAADSPYYGRSYYGGRNRSLLKNNRHYFHNGDYDYGGGHSGSQDRGKLQSNGANGSTVAVQMVSLPVPATTTKDPAVAVSSTAVVPSSESRSLDEGQRTSIAVKVSPTHLDQKQTLQDEGEEIKQEKIEQSFWKMEKNHGAIVALVLGIVLMTVLLVLAGCRLRHFRKRYRKGRHLNSNEADYLINGMYL